MKYIKNPNGRELYDKNQVLLCNIKQGNFLKTNKLYYEYFQMLLQEGQGHIDWEAVTDENVKKNLKYLFSQLVNIGYIIQEGDLSKAIEEHYNVIYLSLTNHCNLRCRHCCVSAGESSTGEMEFEDWMYVIDSILPLHPDSIELTGGEPIIYHDFQRVLRYLRRVYRGAIGLSTNALLINENNIELIKENIDHISVSIDGYDEESCHKIRGNGVFHEIISKILYLKEMGIHQITASMLVTSYTQSHQEEFGSLCEELGVKPIYRRFAPTGRGGKYDEELMPDSNIYEDINKKELKCVLCKPGKRELNISSNGDVYPCAPLSTIEDLKMGNILREPIQSIIHSESFEKKLEQLRPWNLTKCQECNVNLFCHTCINYILGIRNNPKIFENVCEKTKSILTKTLWG